MLLSFFILNYNPKEIIYYENYNIPTENTELETIFTFKEYFHGNTKYVVKHFQGSPELVQKFGEVFSWNETIDKLGVERLIEAGKILTICDAGTKKYIWRKE